MRRGRLLQKKYSKACGWVFVPINKLRLFLVWPLISIRLGKPIRLHQSIHSLSKLHKLRQYVVSLKYIFRYTGTINTLVKRLLLTPCFTSTKSAAVIFYFCIEHFNSKRYFLILTLKDPML